MSLWNWIFGDRLPVALHDSPKPSSGTVNPATGLPMLSGETYGVDVGGSPFGSDWTDTSRDFGSAGFGSSDPWP